MVERILTHRIRETITDEEKGKYGEKMEEYFVKYKSYSYLHAKWATFDKLLSGDKRFEGKVKRYRTKLAMLGVFAEDEDTFNPEYTVVDRVLDKATQVLLTRGAWVATGYSSRLVGLISESTYLDVIALRSQHG